MESSCENYSRHHSYLVLLYPDRRPVYWVGRPLRSRLRPTPLRSRLLVLNRCIGFVSVPASDVPSAFPHFIGLWTPVHPVISPLGPLILRFVFSTSPPMTIPQTWNRTPVTLRKLPHIRFSMPKFKRKRILVRSTETPQLPYLRPSSQHFDNVIRVLIYSQTFFPLLSL